MASLNFSRDTKVFLEHIESGAAADIWEIPVLDGFSFSQSSNASEITLNEAESSAGVSRRGKAVFTDSISPAEWSFSSYMRPNGGTGVDLGCVEEALWANMIGNGNIYTVGTGLWSGDGTIDKTTPTETVFDFTKSDKSTLGTFNLYFALGGCGHVDDDYSDGDCILYKIPNCVINTAVIDFDIEGIATVQWSGFGGEIVDLPGHDLSSRLQHGISQTGNLVRNKLTTLVATPDAGMVGSFATSYTLPVTAGQITIDNGINYLTPESLCTINKPLLHITGTRNISGNFTAYLDDTPDKTADLWEDLAGATSDVTTDFNLDIQIGGANAPSVLFNFTHAHLEVPQHGIEDVITVDTVFHALDTDISAPNPLIITYDGFPY